MARMIAVAGPSGSGKTAGIRNIDPKEIMLIIPSTTKMQLSFPGSAKKYFLYDKDTKKGNIIRTNKLEHIPAIMKEVNDNLKHVKVLLLEDITHFFNAETQSEAFLRRTSGGEAFQRYSDLAAKIFNSIFRIEELRDDLTFLIHFHTEKEENFRSVSYKFKTPGKLLEKDIDLPSYFNYILYTMVLPLNEDTKGQCRYKYVTNNDGLHDARTPMGLFKDILIDNDMNEVLKAIIKYENREIN